MRGLVKQNQNKYLTFCLQEYQLQSKYRMTLMHNFRCQWIQNGSKNIKKREIEKEREFPMKKFIEAITKLETVASGFLTSHLTQQF